MSSHETDCPNCGVRLNVTVTSMGVPGGKDREEGFCPICGQLVISEMTDGFVYVDLVTTGAVVITNTMTGELMDVTPGGITLCGVTFGDSNAAAKFIALHWSVGADTDVVPSSRMVG